MRCRKATGKVRSAITSVGTSGKTGSSDVCGSVRDFRATRRDAEAPSEQIKQPLQVVAFRRGALLITRPAADFLKQILRAAVDILALHHIAV